MFGEFFGRNPGCLGSTGLCLVKLSYINIYKHSFQACQCTYTQKMPQHLHTTLQLFPLESHKSTSSGADVHCSWNVKLKKTLQVATWILNISGIWKVEMKMLKCFGMLCTRTRLDYSYSRTTRMIIVPCGMLETTKQLLRTKGVLPCQTKTCTLHVYTSIHPRVQYEVTDHTQCIQYIQCTPITY